MPKNRPELLNKIWNSQDQAYDLMYEYDELPHRYGDHILYQAEAHIVDLIAMNPDITITDLAKIVRKSPSACSQTVRKLREKGLVNQERNSLNNRQFKLRLSEDGTRLYKAHAKFSEECKKRTFQKLNEFSEEELRIYLQVQERLNEAYAEDVRQSREFFA